MKMRRTALLILYTKDDKILLQHRNHDAPRNPNNWGCFGGGIEEGETPEQAVRRESFEEIEYRLQNPKLIDAEAENQDREITTYTFVEEYDQSQPIVLHEGQGYGWFTLEEALKLPMSNHRRVTLTRLWPLILHETENIEP